MSRFFCFCNCMDECEMRRKTLKPSAAATTTTVVCLNKQKKNHFVCGFCWKQGYESVVSLWFFNHFVISDWNIALSENLLWKRWCDSVRAAVGLVSCFPVLQSQPMA
ncbi:hypothetical protein SAY87_023900 [Trapa incisa]|uniref:Uncharacterized protein n=1 Tax=Trapa incisa TaxID=236973 RepID=A0AAN7QQR4_9MYRT|nr:hypothetical protein SAY87_023900 [Trapa incisa]